MELNLLDGLYGLGNQQIAKKICVPLVILAEKGEPTVCLFLLFTWLDACCCCYVYRSTSCINFWQHSLGATHCASTPS